MLLGAHRLVAARLAVVFSTMFVIGALSVGLTMSKASSFVAAALGAVMLSVAMVMLARAKRQFARLSRRRDELQRLLGAVDR